MNKLKSILVPLILIIFILFPTIGFGQGLIRTSLRSNFALKNEFQKRELQKMISLGITDTLTLPFFEDFTEAGLYPHTARWTDNDVYVNNTMCMNPPSYGVATFDHLDAKGNPYSGISKTGRQDADTLTSQPINLKDFASNDSVFISFFYQSAGFGDAPSVEDKLRLEFKNDTNGWIEVWIVSGSIMTTFNQILLHVNNAKFFHESFQFRFINNTFQTGNLNHWNLDYIRVDKNRNSVDFVIDDMTINSNPSPLLKNYRSMPYYQYKANLVAETADELNVRANNLYNIDRQAQFRLDFYDQNNTRFFNYPFNLNSKNVLKFSDTLGLYNKVGLSTLLGDRPEVTYIWQIDSFKNQNNTPDVYNSKGNNNIIEAKLKFDNYLAYDDGSAEAGIGLDYSALPPGDGYFCVQYNLNVSDSIHGVAIYFNQSLEDVSSRPFELKVWQSISLPPAVDMSNDVELKSIALNSPVYTDSINGFHYIMFDKAIKLNQGKFYVGWKQDAKYILNVGLDENYTELNNAAPNSNIYYSLFGNWLKSRTISGAPMIRPIIGKKAWLPVSLNSVNQEREKLIIYPNPVKTVLHVQKIEKATYTIYNILGTKVLSSKSNVIAVESLKKGVYVVLVNNKSRQFAAKFIKE